MVDLLQKAERAGKEQHTAFADECLADAFGIWLSGHAPAGITEEEEDAIRAAYEKGLGIRVHEQA